LALWPTQLGSTLGQGYEIKSEVLLGNIWGKHWEFVVNPLGTQENNMGTDLERKKSQKSQIPSLSPKGKKTGPLTYMRAHLNGPVKILVVNLFVTIFNIGQ
jgi:hypothetical protein